MPGVAAFPLADYVLPFLPNQMLLVSLCVLQPARWWRFALAFVLASGAGAILAAVAVQSFGPSIIESVLGARPEGASIDGVRSMLERYGIWALVILAMLPWPPRTAVVVCALFGTAPWTIGAAVMAGRLVPSAAYSLAGAKAPHVLRKMRTVDQVLRDVEVTNFAARSQRVDRRSHPRAA